MRYELKSIGIWAFIKVMFFLNLIFGFMFGVFYAIVLIPLVTALGAITGFDNPALAEMPSMGAMLIFMPILFALFSAFFNTLIAVIIAAVYNGITRLLGGFEFTFDAIADVIPVRAVQPSAPQSSYPAQAQALPTQAAVVATPPPPPPPYQPPPQPIPQAPAPPPPEAPSDSGLGLPSASTSEPDEDDPRKDET